MFNSFFERKLLISDLKLPRTFYDRSDVTQIAKGLLGKKLISMINEQRVEGIITEVEAYAGRNDKACHANNGKRTARTEVMFGPPGHAYVYLCYGMHHMLNIVTNSKDLADAVLIRSMEPTNGENHILNRRKKSCVKPELTCGPGNLGKALGLDHRQHNGIDLCGDKIWIEEGDHFNEYQIIATTRVGIDYAEEDALKPWRFYLKDSIWVSKG